VLVFGPSGNQDIPKGRVVIDYWEKWTADEEAQMRVIVNQFNDTVGKDKNIFVRYVSTSSVTQKTLVATAAGVPPDIAGLFDGNLVQFAELGALEPLETMAADHHIDASTYKPVYWKACHYNGHLYALISTPAMVALHYNTQAFADHAADLRAAGLDPTRAPQSIDEVDRYSKVLEQVDKDGRIVDAGYLPMEPGWYVNSTHIWFGGSIWDAARHKFTLTDPAVVKAYTWVQSYSRRLGESAISEFRSGQGNFDSPQNAFLAGTVLMEQQGPWMANYILNLKPSMAGVKSAAADDPSLPLAVRQARMHWAAAPFPSDVPGLNNVSVASFDTLVIPRGAKHKKEAFEFIAFVNRQDVMEHLCKMHSKNSPLEKVSDDFLNHHKNPYIKVFEDLSRSPNAQSAPQIPILPEVTDKMNTMIQRLALHPDTDPKAELQKTQDVLQQDYDRFMAIQAARRKAEKK
jgi:ABC-type glycerol-3-phosphate transport system substrate-binding protein